MRLLPAWWRWWLIELTDECISWKEQDPRFMRRFGAEPQPSLSHCLRTWRLLWETILARVGQKCRLISETLAPYVRYLQWSDSFSLRSCVRVQSLARRPYSLFQSKTHLGIALQYRSLAVAIYHQVYLSQVILARYFSAVRANLSRNESFSSGLPTVTRMQSVQCSS